MFQESRVIKYSQPPVKSNAAFPETFRAKSFCLSNPTPIVCDVLETEGGGSDRVYAVHKKHTFTPLVKQTF